jgi:predicted nuclease with RNAse H fold
LCTPVAVAGDDAPVAILERGWVREARSEADPRRRLELIVRGVCTIAARAAPLMEVLRDAAAVEPEMRALLEERHRRRYETQKAMVEVLLAGRSVRSPLTLRQAADVFFALVGHDMYRLFVLRRGWTVRAWQAWLVDSLDRELFQDAHPART